MQMLPVDQKKYPKLKYYVSVNLPQIIKVPAVVQAMREIGSLKRVQFLSAIAWGKGPTIKIAPLAGEYGEFTPFIKSNEIRIQTAMVEEFEKTGSKKATRAGTVYLVGVTLMHELVHWGDDQTGKDRPGEEGEEFEKAVYRAVIN